MRNLMEEYLQVKTTDGQVEFMEKILHDRNLQFSTRLKILAKFCELEEARKGTTDFKYFGATCAVKDALSDYKFI